MKTLKYLIYIEIFFLLACWSISCKEVVSEELQILIQNKTDSPIRITLYPKKTAASGHYLYPICEGCGGHKETEFILFPNDGSLYEWGEVVFYSTDLNIEPHTLTSKAFDSIHISLTNKDNVIIKFTHENVTGYSENIFTENAVWDFRIEEDNLQTQFRRNPVRYYCYSFLISEDKVTIE